jgi:signal transduction histidine kinase
MDSIGRQKDLPHSFDRQKLLWEAASVLLTADETDALMRELFAKLTPHFGLDAYFHFAVNETQDALRLESCLGISEATARLVTRLEFGQGVCGTAALQRRPVVATCIQQSDDPQMQMVKSQGIRVYACNPLLVDDRLLGTLSFASRSRDQFEKDELEFLQTLCDYVARAYEQRLLIRQLHQTSRKKDEFLATLAHELRNPLAPIRNAAQYLRLKGSMEPDLQNARDIIDRQVRHLARLVDDLLDVSRIARDKIILQKERLALGVVLTSAIESSRPLIESAGHELIVCLPPEPVYVEGDLTRLAQVFGNLLVNAAKYTDRGGRIWLTADRQGSDVVISVKDTGIGIPADHLPHLFEMFRQAAPTLERSQGGLGIGLALVKGLVELHGGSIEAQSDGPGKGSEFLVRLPLAFEAPMRREVEEMEGEPIMPRNLRCRVLVADDNHDATLTLAMMLSYWGHEVRTAHDGQAAVELAEAFQPNVILLDIGMPKLNGYDAARRIRQHPWGQAACLIALTGWGQEEDKRRAKESGFDRHFTKPVDPSCLQKLLAEIRSPSA